MTVFTPTEDGPYAELAERIASSRNEPLVTEFRDVGPEETLCVADPMELTENLANKFQRRLDRNGPESGSYGIITGITPQVARDLYEREPVSKPNHCIIVRQEDKERFSYDDDTSVYTRHTSTVENVQELLNDGLESLSSMFDARSIHGYLSDGYICGVPTNHDVMELEGKRPPCIESGERNCPLDGDLIPADELAVDHMFLNSCMSMLPSNDESGTTAHVGMNVLQNAVSVIGGYRPLDGLLHQTVLHYALLRAGYSAIERTYLLNKQAHALDVEYLPFLLFGTPDVSIVEPSENTYDATITESDRGVYVDIDDACAHVFDVTVPFEAEESGRGPYLRNLTDEHGDAPLYYVTVPQDESVRVLIYTWGRIDVDELRFELLPENPHERQYHRLHNCLQNVKKMQELSLGGRQFKGHIKNFRNHLVGSSSYIDEQRYRANVYREAEERFDTALENAERLRDQIRNTLEDRGPSFLSNEYRDQCIPQNVRIDPDPCYSCGRPVYIKEFTTLTGNVTRVRGICPTCINTYDVPKTGERIVHPTIEGELRIEEGETRDVSLSFENPKDIPLEAEYFLWLCSAEGDVRGAQIFTPERRALTLDPGEQGSARFEIDPPSDLIGDDYTLYGYVIGNMDVYAGMRTVHLQQEGRH